MKVQSLWKLPGESALSLEYRRFRCAGENAGRAIRSARTLLAFQDLERMGMARIRVENDDHPDVSWMDEKDRKKWDGYAYGTIGEVYNPATGKWDQVDACWGHIGYDDPGSPYENCYIVDIMAACIDVLDDAETRDLIAPSAD